MVKSKKSLEEIYNILDDDGDGILSIEEIIKGLATMGVTVTEKEARKIKLSLDANGDGFIWKDEFIDTLREPFEL